MRQKTEINEWRCCSIEFQSIFIIGMRQKNQRKLHLPFSRIVSIHLHYWNASKVKHKITYCITSISFNPSSLLECVKRKMERFTFKFFCSFNPSSLLECVKSKGDLLNHRYLIKFQSIFIIGMRQKRKRARRN